MTDGGPQADLDLTAPVLGVLTGLNARNPAAENLKGPHPWSDLVRWQVDDQASRVFVTSDEVSQGAIRLQRDERVVFEDIDVDGGEKRWRRDGSLSRSCLISWKGVDRTTHDGGDHEERGEHHKVPTLH
jgi:hypothetical protein